MAFADTWRWSERAAQRVDELSRARAHPAQRAIVGLQQLLGESGMLAYLSYMAERLAVLRRLLKPTGSLYLHCDPTASHYLKILLDTIFGSKHFRNEIVWCYRKWTNAARYFQRNHDTVLFYSKGASYTFNKLYDPNTPQAAKYEKGWDTNRIKGVRQLIVYDEQKAEEKIKAGKYDRVVYRPGTKGTAYSDWWELNYLASGSKERLGYPTQKPLALLERILRASSNEGDLVLDPFCGCGTTVAAAHALGRRWLGIDISPFAIDLIVKRRFQGMQIGVQGVPTDMDGAARLARSKPFDFEKWAVTRIPGMAPNQQQVGDGGVDGRGTLILKPERHSNLVLAQVKGGEMKAGELRDFLYTLEREQAALGVFITLREPGARQRENALAALAEAGRLRLGASEYPRAQLWSIERYFRGQAPQLPALADPFTGRAIPDEMQMRFL